MSEPSTRVLPCCILAALLTTGCGFIANLGAPAVDGESGTTVDAASVADAGGGHDAQAPADAGGGDSGDLDDAGASTDAGIAIWDLGQDFRRGPDVQNPSADRYDNLAVWSYRYATIDQQGDPSMHMFLEDFEVEDEWQRWCWAADEFSTPLVAVDANQQALMHPGTQGAGRELVIARWTSPVAGTIHISGALRDVDTGGGNGVDWWLYGGPVESVVLLESGSFDNGGSQMISPITLTIDVSGLVFLAVGPQAYHPFDNTEVDLTITLE